MQRPGNKQLEEKALDGQNLPVLNRELLPVWLRQHKTSGLKASSDWLSDKPCQAALRTPLPRKVLIKEQCNHASSFAKMIFILMFLNHFPHLKLRNLPTLPSEGWRADHCEAPAVGLRSKLWTKEMLDQIWKKKVTHGVRRETKVRYELMGNPDEEEDRLRPGRLMGMAVTGLYSSPVLPPARGSEGQTLFLRTLTHQPQVSDRHCVQTLTFIFSLAEGQNAWKLYSSLLSSGPWAGHKQKPTFHSRRHKSLQILLLPPP